jgi:predicted O-linked N-acetylglucosamine transferase (SPINDLY family)
MRRSLRARLAASALCDEAAFARAMEDVLMGMCRSRGLGVPAGE